MIELNRSKENKWILQKNINKISSFINLLEVLDNQDNEIDHELIKEQLRGDSYSGRSDEGSANTIGVRLSQACFYMFGYKYPRNGEKFFPSPMTNLLLSKETKLSKQQIGLINLYSMQFPTYHSDTNSNFKIYVGRLFIKLLLDIKLDEKLYIDECIFFLMFLEKMDLDSYCDLVDSILSFRELSFQEKEEMFRSIEDCDDVFSNATHEMNYYFIRIFKGFGVFNTVEDRFHNEGNLLKFIHGNHTAVRNDAYKSHARYSGYITLDSNIKNDAIKLNQTFDAFETPCTLADPNIFSERDWISEIYQFKPLEYIETIMVNDDVRKEIIENIKNMVYQSKYGTNDGKSFEDSLEPVFYMFRESCNVEVQGGPGKPDLVCAMNGENEDIYKISIDAKKTRARTFSINPARINRHRHGCGAEYAIVVSPKFARGVMRDIENYPIVTIEAETLANYCLNACLSSSDNLADFKLLDIVIKSNLGSDITKKVNNLIDEEFGIT